MTAEARLSFPRVVGHGRWIGREVSGAVTLFIEAREVIIRLEDGGEELTVSMQALTGAGWKSEVLSLHMETESLHLRSTQSLDRACLTITQRACALPEVARGLRALGSARGGGAEWQGRFFGPLLQARRRLEEGEPVDWQVAGFDAKILAERLRGVLASMAHERHAERPPYRRSLEAELAEAAEPVFRQLSAVDEAAKVLHSSADAQRFVYWRAWSREVRALFVEADRSCEAVVGALSRRQVDSSTSTR